MLFLVIFSSQFIDVSVFIFLGERYVLLLSYLTGETLFLWRRISLILDFISLPTAFTRFFASSSTRHFWKSSSSFLKSESKSLLVFLFRKYIKPHASKIHKRVNKTPSEIYPIKVFVQMPVADPNTS